MATGARFAKWGLGLFIFGVFLTFGVIAHYCVGSRWPNGTLFMQNITLWWACPWTHRLLPCRPVASAWWRWVWHTFPRDVHRRDRREVRRIRQR
jgi:hypothetical protein